MEACEDQGLIRSVEQTNPAQHNPCMCKNKNGVQDIILACVQKSLISWVSVRIRDWQPQATCLLRFRYQVTVGLVQQSQPSLKSGKIWE